MSISDEFTNLQALHENGTLTDDEFAAAKVKVLAEERPLSTTSANSVQRDIQRLQIQNEILRLDQEWSAERENYMLRGRYGRAYVPTIGNTIGPALALIVIGLFLFASAYPVGQHPNGMSYIGLLLLIVGIAYAVSGSLKAKAYDAAYGQHQRQRRELKDQLEALG